MSEIKVELISGDQGIRFAGPDLLYYDLLVKVTGGELDGSRIRIFSQFHPCCGVLEIRAESLEDITQVWRNGFSGLEKHQPSPAGKKAVRDIVWGLSEYYSRKKFIDE